MAISPFNFGAKKNDAATRAPSASNPDRLSLSQALTITAGLAGLVGLCSGIVIRFSLANSDNARFLSPLQTFPTLSSWTPEEAAVGSGDADVRRLTVQDADDLENRASLRESMQEESRLFQSEEWSDTGDLTTENPWVEESASGSALRENSETNISEEPLRIDVNTGTFDSFADRTDEGISIGDPWKRLEEGPQFGSSDQFDSPVYEEGDRLDKESADDLNSEPVQSYYENAYDEPEDESWYGGSYEDNSYKEGSYDEAPYGSSSYDNSSYDDSSYDDSSYRETPDDYE